MTDCPICGKEPDGGAWFHIEYRHGGTGKVLAAIDVCGGTCGRKAFPRLSRLLRPGR
jgi:hypothetical protein